MINNIGSNGGIVVAYNKQNIPIPIYRDLNKTLHFHSLYSIETEQEQVFEEYYEQGIDSYVVFGFGFGYHIHRFVDAGLKVKIIVLNSDCFELANQYIDMSSWTNKENVEFIKATDTEEFNKTILDIDTKGAKLIFHTPSIEVMSNANLKENILFLHIKINSYKRFEDQMKINYANNLVNKDKDLVSYLSVLQDENIIIVAGGPSLKYDVELIKKSRDKLFVLTVGTSLKFLLSNDVVPDAVIITDPSDAVYNQIKDVQIDIPLIVLSTANKMLLENWAGDKIICYQEGFSVEGNELIVDTGGSVTTTAVDIAIKSGCKNIILAGCDFSYSDNLTHVPNAQFSRSISEDDDTLIKVANYSGGFNNTNRGLLMFKKWIENKIDREQVTIYNITKNGARIEGTLRRNYSEVESIIK